MAWRWCDVVGLLDGVAGLRRESVELAHAISRRAFNIRERWLKNYNQR